MAKMKFKGLDNYVAQLNKLDANTREIIGKTIYDGADVVADAIKDAIDSLPVDNAPYSPDRIKTGISTAQKVGLQKSFGVAKMRVESSVYNVKLGFDGYNAVKTKKYPKGQPNAMIARSVESGTSFMAKHPFVSKATRSSKKTAEQKMKVRFENEIEKIMK